MLSDLFVFFLGNGERLWSSIEPFRKSLLSFRELSMSLTPLILTYCSYRHVFHYGFRRTRSRHNCWVYLGGLSIEFSGTRGSWGIDGRRNGIVSLRKLRGAEIWDVSRALSWGRWRILKPVILQSRLLRGARGDRRTEGEAHITDHTPRATVSFDVDVELGTC